MAVGDIEQIVEGMVNRGLVSPKMVGRTVGQATIEELKNLGSNLAQSQATRQQELNQRQYSFKTQQAQNLQDIYSNIQGPRAQKPQFGQIKDPTKPFAISFTKDQGIAYNDLLNIAVPNAKGGYTIRTGTPANIEKSALAKMALENVGVTATDKLGLMHALPDTGKHVYWGGAKKVANLQDLITEISTRSNDVSLIKRLFGG